MGRRYSPASLKASGSATSHTRIQPRDVPVHKSPQGVRQSDVTDPTLWACVKFMNVHGRLPQTPELYWYGRGVF